MTRRSFLAILSALPFLRRKESVRSFARYRQKAAMNDMSQMIWVRAEVNEFGQRIVKYSNRSFNGATQYFQPIIVNPKHPEWKAVT